MTNIREWNEKALEDLARADLARKEGNEGRARVCARRAAGWAAGAYLEAKHYPYRKSGFQNILLLAEYDESAQELARLCKHLSASLEKEGPDDDSHLPADVDLLADARQLIRYLFPDFSE